MATYTGLQFFRGHGVDSLLWSSTVGYPIDSLASCFTCVIHVAALYSVF